MTENEEIRLEKLRTYYEYFNLQERYGWSFPEFTRLVDNGTYAEIQKGL